MESETLLSQSIPLEDSTVTAKADLPAPKPSPSPPEENAKSTGQTAPQVSSKSASSPAESLLIDPTRSAVFREVAEAAAAGDIERINKLVKSLNDPRTSSTSGMDGANSVPASASSIASSNSPAAAETTSQLPPPESSIVDASFSQNPRPSLSNQPQPQPTLLPPTVSFLDVSVAALPPLGPPEILTIPPDKLHVPISVNLRVLNSNGDVEPLHLNLPNLPLIILQVNTKPKPEPGKVIALNFSPGYFVGVVAGCSGQGAGSHPITIPINVSVEVNAPAPLPETPSEPPASAINLPVIQQLPPPPPAPVKSNTTTVSGPRSLRPIAPKPNSSVPGTLPATAVSLRAGQLSRQNRKIFTAATTAATMTASTVTMASMPLLRKASAPSSLTSSSSSSSRNRNRRKNLANSILQPAPVPQATALPAATSAACGFIIDPNSRTLVPADASAMSGGYVQPLSANGAQFFAPGSILVGSSNGLISMPIGSMIPAENKPPDGELLTTVTAANSGFLEGFSQQLFITTNGGGGGGGGGAGGTTNGQFIQLPGYQTTGMPGGEYVQSFSTTQQPTEYLQTNGGEIYVTSDGSYYMPYPGVMGQAQPVATVDIKDDGVMVDGGSESDDIIELAMRVAQEDVEPETVNIDLSEDATSHAGMGDFMPQEAQEPQQQQNQVQEVGASPGLEKTPPASTGDAKIDALLAEAALVSSVNGVGDNQSAVSVPVSSLLVSRCSVGQTTTVSTAENKSGAQDMHEFTKSLYDSFANFETTETRNPTATGDDSFSYFTQKADDLAFDATSFLQSLNTPAGDDLDANKNETVAASQPQADASASNKAGEDVEDLLSLPFAPEDSQQHGNNGDDGGRESNDESFLHFESGDYDASEVNFDEDMLIEASASPRLQPPSPEDNDEDEEEGGGREDRVASAEESLLPPNLSLHLTTPPGKNASSEDDDDEEEDDSGSELDFLPSRKRPEEMEKPPEATSPPKQSTPRLDRRSSSSSSSSSTTTLVSPPGGGNRDDKDAAPNPADSTLATEPCVDESTVLLTSWEFHEEDRPHSFGLNAGGTDKTLLPLCHQLETHVDIQNNPVLQEKESFWGDRETLVSSEDGSSQDEPAAATAVVQTTVTDSDTDSAPSLRATIRAEGFDLHLLSSEDTTVMPGVENECAFSQFATSVSLPSFDTVAKEKDADDDAVSSSPSTSSSSSSEGTITPNSCIPDPTKVTFAQGLFNPQFPVPMISSSASDIVLPVVTASSFTTIAETVNSTVGVLRPTVKRASAEVEQVEEVVVREEGAEHLPVQCEAVSKVLEVPLVPQVASATTIDPPTVHQMPSAQQESLQIVDLPDDVTESRSSSNSSSGSHTEKLILPPIRLKLNLAHLAALENKRRRERKKRKAASLVPSVSAAASPPKSRKVMPLRLSRVGGQLCSLMSSEGGGEIEESNDSSTSSTSNSQEVRVQQPIWAASKPSSGRGRGRRRGRGRGNGLQRSPPPPPSLPPPPPPPPPSSAPTIAKKFFSSSREDRRSSAIITSTSRPWRGSGVRKRGRYANTATSLERRRNSSTSTAAAVKTSPKTPQPSVDAGLRVVIRPGGSNKETRGEEETEDEAVTIASSNQEQEEASDAHFFVAPEPETFVDRNQARVRLVVNRALYEANGLDPPGSADDDDEEEEEDEVEEAEEAPKRSQTPALPPQQSYRAYQQPQGFVQQQTVAPCTTSARSSSTAASTISPPAPFNTTTTTASSSGANEGFYHQKREVENTTTLQNIAAWSAAAAAAYFDPRQAMQAVWASASSLLGSHGVVRSGQQASYQQQTATAHSSVTPNTPIDRQIAQQQPHPPPPHPPQTHHQQIPHHHQQQQQQQQPIFPPSSNEAHQRFNPAQFPGDELGYYHHHHHHHQQWQYNQQQMGEQQPSHYQNQSRPPYYAAAVSQQQQQQPTSSSGQWYPSGGHMTPSGAGPAMSTAVSSATYPQFDDPAVVAAVAAAGYRLPPFPRLS